MRAQKSAKNIISDIPANSVIIGLNVFSYVR